MEHIDWEAADYLPEVVKTHFNKKTVVPLRTTGDGNCLLNAVSRAIFGVEIYWELLRTLVVDELKNNFDWYKESTEIEKDEWDKALTEVRLPISLLSMSLTTYSTVSYRLMQNKGNEVWNLSQLSTHLCLVERDTKTHHLIRFGQWHIALWNRRERLCSNLCSWSISGVFLCSNLASLSFMVPLIELFSSAFLLFAHLTQQGKWKKESLRAVDWSRRSTVPFSSGLPSRISITHPTIRDVELHQSGTIT